MIKQHLLGNRQIPYPTIMMKRRLLQRLVSGRSKAIPGDYHNMPQKYIDRHVDFVYVRRPNTPNVEVKTEVYKPHAYYDVWRPWEAEFNKLNKPGIKTRKIFVEPKREWSYFRGDRVEILKGSDKGKQGIINYIVKERNWVFVEGLNLKRTEGDLGIIRCLEEPLLVDDEVKLVDPSDLKATEFEWRYDANGDRFRVSTRTERIIPIPKVASETIDYKTKAGYQEQPKDTPAEAANEVTFIAQSRTFEMDICDQMNIKEDRAPYPMYWY